LHFSRYFKLFNSSINFLLKTNISRDEKNSIIGKADFASTAISIQKDETSLAVRAGVLTFDDFSREKITEKIFFGKFNCKDFPSQPLNVFLSTQINILAYTLTRHFHSLNCYYVPSHFRPCLKKPYSNEPVQEKKKKTGERRRKHRS
jgi:hypothetical protein